MPRRLPRADSLVRSADSTTTGRRMATFLERLGNLRSRSRPEGGGHDRDLRPFNEVGFAGSYIHEYPVRRERCESPADRRWSGARPYEHNGRGAIKREVPPPIRAPPGILPIAFLIVE